MPAQGTWVHTGGGAVGRFVGHTKTTTWVWYTRTEARHGVSFEAMCESFDRFVATCERFDRSVATREPAPNVPAEVKEKIR
jgi:hypothetical protein